MKTFCVIGALLLVAACGSSAVCDEPDFYENAQSGKRIEAPEDLDNLPANKELVIPEPSPRAARSRESGCLDKPPTLKISAPDKKKKKKKKKKGKEKVNENAGQS